MKERKVCVSVCYLKASASARSCVLKSVGVYPSRLNASTAFGPSHTLPSIRGVKWTPRNGNRGSGTYTHTHTHSNLLTHTSLCFLSVDVCQCVLLTVVKCLATGGELLQLFRDLCHQYWESRSGKPTFFPLVFSPFLFLNASLPSGFFKTFVWKCEVSTLWYSKFLDMPFPSECSKSLLMRNYSYVHVFYYYPNICLGWCYGTHHFRRALLGFKHFTWNSC